MFSNLFNLSKKRTKLQALGFYIFYLILGIIFGALASASISVFYCVLNSDICVTYDQGFVIGKKVGSVVGLCSVFVYVFALGMWILYAKKLFLNVYAVLLYVLSILLAIPFGAVTALIPLTFITKMDSRIEHEDDEYNDKPEA